jgi:hypothetical protein
VRGDLETRIRDLEASDRAEALGFVIALLVFAFLLVCAHCPRQHGWCQTIREFARYEGESSDGR